MMLHTFECRSSISMLLLWKTYLRPIMECGTTVIMPNVLNISKEGLQKKIGELKRGTILKSPL